MLLLHRVIGGLGPAVTEALKNIEDISITLIGIEDHFGRSDCDYDELLDYYSSSIKNIIKK